MTGQNGRSGLPRWLEELAAPSGWEPPAADDEGVLTRPGSSHPVSYPEEALTALHAHGGTSWWHEHRLRWAIDALGKAGAHTVVDVGAGSGAMASGLLRAGLEVLAVEPLYEGARLTRRRGVPTFAGRLGDLAFPEGTLPAVCYFDVLEHLAEPGHELAEAYRVLMPGGVVLVTVPAYAWLWSTEDTLAGHVRRYTRASLISMCEAAGLIEVRTGHLFASLVVPAFLTRRVPYLMRRGLGRQVDSSGVSQQLSPAPVLTWVARIVLSLETVLDSVVPLPFGLSIVGVFRKPLAPLSGKG